MKLFVDSRFPFQLYIYWYKIGKKSIFETRVMNKLNYWGTYTLHFFKAYDDGGFFNITGDGLRRFVVEKDTYMLHFVLWCLDFVSKKFQNAIMVKLISKLKLLSLKFWYSNKILIKQRNKFKRSENDIENPANMWWLVTDKVITIS